MPVGPGVDDIEHGAGRFGRHEAEHVLQDRVHDGVQPVLGEGRVVVLRLPDVDVAQPALGAPGQVGDQARRAFRAQAVLDAGVGLGVDRHVVGECVGHRVPLNIDPKLLRANIGIMTRMPGPVKRRYDATGRRQAAARTRAAILDAARQLFTERGYAATAMTAIAERAGVALDTIYASVGRKPELARLLVETAISGTDQAIPAEQRDYVRAIQAAPDADTKIAIYAAAVTAIAPRLALVYSIIQQAAPAEPELAALWAEIAERRAANMRRFVADLATVTPLRLDPGQAADIIWATNAAEMYQLLTVQRGWSPQRYQRFLADTWRRLLLPG